MVVRTWGLPVSVQTAITQHHTVGEFDVFTNALKLADRVAHAVASLGDLEDGEDELGPLVGDGDELANACGIAPTTLSVVVTDTADLARDVVAAYHG